MINVLVVFGSMTPEHDLSCMSAGYIKEQIDREKFNPIFVGITADGKWLYTEASADEIRDAKAWEQSATNRKAILDTDFGAKQLLVFEADGSVSKKPVDVVFARIAGNTGEDGKLQGLWELAGIPYVGCGVMASAVSMDKEISYLFADELGLRRPKTYAVWAHEYRDNREAVLLDIKDKLTSKLGYPVFAKPASTGSSIGITKVHEEAELAKALDDAFQYGDKVVLEEGITGSEIKVGVLGNDDVEIGAICELLSNGDFNDFSTKYLAHTSTKNIPADLSPEVEAMIKEKTIAIYKAMNCRGFSRIDFFLTEDNELVFNEINSMPGFKPESLYPELFKAVGVEYTELITRLLELALED